MMPVTLPDVSNAEAGTDQIPVMVLNKTYYGCCEKCVRDLNTDETVRFAVDPYSKQTVDKALAFITMSPAKPGNILYFESEL
ncbi:MAG: TRASH domain-containing protein [Cyclobacteriaceae bacterium]